jgi:hypothetical protein
MSNTGCTTLVTSSDLKYDQFPQSEYNKTQNRLAHRRLVVTEALAKAPSDLDIPESDIAGIDPDSELVVLHNGRKVPFHDSWETL